VSARKRASGHHLAMEIGAVVAFGGAAITGAVGLLRDSSDVGMWCAFIACSIGFVICLYTMNSAITSRRSS
jgi:hypothetical protein